MTGDEFHDARLTLGVSTDELAKIVGVSRRSAFRYDASEWPVPRPLALLIRMAVKYPAVRHELGIRDQAPPT